jgi:hypothetical protein
MSFTETATVVRVQVVQSMKGDLGTDAKLKAILSDAIMAGVKAYPHGGPEAGPYVAAVSRGAMQGFFLLEKDLADISVKIMTLVAEVAMDSGLDTEFLMRWSLVGLAEAGEVGPPGTLDNIRGALDSAFLGVGRVFEDVCRDVAAAHANSPRVA